MWTSRRAFAALFMGAFASLACTSWAADTLFPDVLSAQVKARAPDTFDFDVTMSSPYDSAQRYADGFRAMGPDGAVLGVRKLLHDHASEQPFTRDLYGVKVPQGVRVVTIQGRDKVNGWGGKTQQVPLPGR